MDTLNNKNIIIKSELVNYTHRGRTGGVPKICYFFAIVVNEKNNTTEFCVEGISNHIKLNSLINKDVNLIARESWASIDIDDIEAQ